ncbi:MAG TPA: ATP-binding protein [Saprospiraceae bacterium]|nr:ATP-binding protein [Saprospiraceae bacterium]HMQ85361.1 ATP-binding protein [Saprospiraceae bacterium]
MFSYFWQKITNIGVDEQLKAREVIRVRLLNQVISLAFITSLLTLVTYLWTWESTTIIFTTLVNILVELSGYVLHHYRKYQTARFIACFVFPTVIAMHVVILGGNFGETNIFAAFAVTAFLLYENKRWVQFSAIAYICLLFTFSKLYAIQAFSLESVAANPYDEIITFPMILIILGWILYLYQREKKTYEVKNKQLIYDLEVKNKELSQLNSELDQFTYTASHDLKSPLRNIRSHLDIIDRKIKRKSYEELELDLHFAKDGANKMYALVSDILEYKRISAQAEGFEPVNLNLLFVEALAHLHNAITLKNALVESVELPTIHARKSDFLVLLINLIDNGVKYNESLIPSIRIDYLKGKNHFQLRFSDNGIGIEEVYFEVIFQYFKRLHNDSKYPGTGIGLGLCHKIVQYYQGKIFLNSVPDKGSTFIVELSNDLLLHKEVPLSMENSEI